MSTFWRNQRCSTKLDTVIKIKFIYCINVYLVFYNIFKKWNKINNFHLNSTLSAVECHSRSGTNIMSWIFYSAFIWRHCYIWFAPKFFNYLAICKIRVYTFKPIVPYVYYRFTISSRTPQTSKRNKGEEIHIRITKLKRGLQLCKILKMNIISRKLSKDISRNIVYFQLI